MLPAAPQTALNNANSEPTTLTPYVLTVTCKSTRGVVAAISTFLAEKGCNIIDSSQFDDLDTGKFFMRVSFISEEGVLRRDLGRLQADRREVRHGG